MEWNQLFKFLDPGGIFESLQNAMNNDTEFQKQLSVSASFKSFIRSLNSSAIVSITNKEGIILEVNHSFCELSQYSEDELIGKKHNIINSGFHSPEFWADMWKTILAGKHWRADVRNQAKDGSFYWVDTNINPIFNDQGEIVQFLSIRNLITDRKNLEERLERKNKSLQSALSLLQEEIGFAETVQNLLMPKECHFLKDRVHVHALFLPLQVVSGDIYDYFPIPGDTLRVFIADATGHGLRAGFQTMSIQTEYQRVKATIPKPKDVLDILNDGILRIFPSLPVHYSCALFDINIKKHTITYSSAGHPDAILLYRNEVILFPPLAPLQGSSPDTEFFQKTIPYGAGARLIVFSDGIIDEFNSSLEYYGMDRLIAFSKRMLSLSPTLYLEELLVELKQFSGRNQFSDDITAVVIDL